MAATRATPKQDPGELRPRTIRVDDVTWKEAQAIYAERGTNISAEVRRLLTRTIKRAER